MDESSEKMISRKFEVAAGTNENGEYEVYASEVWHDNFRNKDYDYSRWMSCHETQEQAKHEAAQMNKGCYYWKPFGQSAKKLALYHSHKVNMLGCVICNDNDTWNVYSSDTATTERIGSEKKVNVAMTLLENYYTK